MTARVEDWARVVDELHFTFLGGGEHESSCRLQVLKSVDGEVLFVAVQQSLKEGTSLITGAEGVIEAAWRKYAANLETPPPMHARLTGNHYASDDDITFLVPGEEGGLRAGWRKPSALEWGVITTHADFDRGSQWEGPPDPEATMWFVWREFPVGNLPASNIWKARWVDCTPLVTPKRRRFRKPPPVSAAVAPAGVESCCEFHAGSWQTASDLARQALSSLTTVAVENRGQVEYQVRRWLKQRTSNRWLFLAASSLVDTPIVLNGRHGYQNGAHRAQAMRDQHVEKTIVEELVPMGSELGGSTLLFVPHV